MAAQTEPTRPAGPARTLADVLRTWPETRLAALLRARPDLAAPAPRDSAQLASRAGVRASVLRVVDQLDRLQLAVLDAAVVLGDAPRERLVAAVNAAPAAVEAAVKNLCDLALLWEVEDGVRALSTVTDALRGDPTGATSGLRPVMPHAQSQDEARARLELLTPKAASLLAHVTDSGGQGTSGRARTPVALEEARSPIEELLFHRLLLPSVDGTLVVPGQVGLALRGGHTTVTPCDDLPEISTTDRAAGIVDRVAAGAAFETVRRVELLLDQWGVHPPTVLRSGGLAVRDHKAVTDELQVDPHTAALLLETAAAAGLLAEGLDSDGVTAWMPTHAYDTWALQSPARRWWTLVKAWLHTPRLAALVGTKDAQGRTRNALAADLTSVHGPETREAVLAELADLPSGQALASGTGAPSLVQVLRWRRPRRPSTRDEIALWTLTEAAALGLTGMDAMSSYGRALALGETDAGLDALDALMPSPVDHVLLQADLTAVAPGPLETSVARTLHLLAEVESRGGATVYRFSASSLRRALDAGWSAAEVHGFLAETSRTPVPQPLTYLVDDVVRTFGTVRVGHAEAFLRADDENALTELLLHPKAESLGLRRIAPTVLISTVPVDLLLPRLRELGQAPVVEAPDGTVRVARPDVQRSRTPKAPPSAGMVEARESARIQTVVATVRTGDRIAANTTPRPTTATTPADALQALREAIEARATVLIGYVDNHGVSTERIVDPLALEGGQLSAYDHRSEDRKVFQVHRITQVVPTPGTGHGAPTGR
ncbi:helicase C-terminal domain-containing protein [Nocardioides yefusunii]|uniref:Helicase-associated domain-containing protein n=1 Tax=Nocardioides yefusunii TaxID=2500546 RepID=A0ABW1R0X1_9ACTN|nr:helicase C-terminal domain-containing protein [Nocardioides yefusunii]